MSDEVRSLSETATKMDVFGDANNNVIKNFAIPLGMFTELKTIKQGFEQAGALRSSLRRGGIGSCGLLPPCPNRAVAGRWAWATLRVSAFAKFSDAVAMALASSLTWARIWLNGICASKTKASEYSPPSPVAYSM